MTTPATSPTPLQRLGLLIPSGWRDTAYSPEIDSVLAQKALDPAQPEVADLAARVIGRVRSVHAVNAIAARQRSGSEAEKRTALHALALVRDETPSLPSSVSAQGRLYAWLVNTRRRLAENGISAMWRFLFASLGGIGAMAYYVVRAYTGPGSQLILAQIWGDAVSIGLSFGLVWGFCVLFAGEIPDRLRGFWRLWARVPLAAVTGFLFTTLLWIVFKYLILTSEVINPSDAFPAGYAAAIVWGLFAAIRLPGWTKALLTAIAFYLPLYVVYRQYWLVDSTTPWIIYFNAFDDVYTWLIPMAVVIGIFSHLQAIAADIRGWRARRSTSGQKLKRADASYN